MKKLTTHLMIATAALVVVAGAASAQIQATMTAQIPFEFRAGNQVMAPGTYQVDDLATQTSIPLFRLANVHARRSIALLAQAAVDPQKDGQWGNRSCCSRAPAEVARSLNSGPGLRATPTRSRVPSWARVKRRT